ncbi:hypothetical protein KI387_029053, partial [Taxus chinensis]
KMYGCMKFSQVRGCCETLQGCCECCDMLQATMRMLQDTFEDILTKDAIGALAPQERANDPSAAVPVRTL